MTITVRLFAILRDLAGHAQLQLDLPEGSTAGVAFGELSLKYPAMEPYLSRIAIAVNQQYVPSSTELHDGDELALIPPVSGG